MGKLQDAFDAEMARLPEIAATQLVSEKLAELGVDDAALAAKIAEHVLSGESDLLELDGPDIELAFTRDDRRRALQIGRNLVDALPAMLKELVEKIGVDFAQSFKDQWQERRFEYAAETSGFKRRLEQRWGPGLDNLRLLLELCRDVGAEFHDRHLDPRRRRNRVRNDVLVRQHIRACQLTAEIISLLEAGFAEGARARWRTLFEVMVATTLIAEGGDALADRFLDHEVVEHKKTMEEYQRCAPLLGEPPLSPRDVASMRKEYEQVLRKHGPGFAEAHGWAAGQLGLNKNPKFAHLQELAGAISMRIYYKLASFGVHASARALSQQLHRFGSSFPIAGACNVGLEEPGSNTAHSLVRITSLLIEEPFDLDKLVMARALIELRDEITRSLYETADEIDREEKRKLRQIMRTGASRAPPMKRRPLRQRSNG